MKKTLKNISFILIVFFVCIGITNAAKCTVVTGNGKTIGDEIKCGTEHFYIVSNDGKTTKMLSKYNLLAGGTIEKITLKEKYESSADIYLDETVQKYMEDGYYVYRSLQETDDENKVYYTAVLVEKGFSYIDDYLRYGNEEYTAYFVDEPVDDYKELENLDEVKKLISDGYKVGGGYKLSSGKYNGIGLYKEVELPAYEDRKVYQDETAIGAHGDEEGKPAPKEVGVVTIDMYDIYGKELYAGEEYDEEYYDFTFSKYIEETDTYEKTELYLLDFYKNTLKSNGFNVEDIGMMTMYEMDALVKEITGKNLPLDTWATESWEKINNTILNEGSYYPSYKVGSIKEHLPKEYSWLWSTTYWMQTMYVSNYYESYVAGDIYFVDTLGNICAAFDCPTSIGAGIRPLVSIPAEDIIYTIKTKTDGNGTIDAISESASGEEITFVVTSNEGYEVDEIKVTKENGEVIIFKDNKFIMPDANVIIEAKFKITNPETGNLNIMLLITLCLISVTIFISYKKQQKWLK